MKHKTRMRMDEAMDTEMEATDDISSGRQRDTHTHKDDDSLVEHTQSRTNDVVDGSVVMWWWWCGLVPLWSLPRILPRPGRRLDRE